MAHALVNASPCSHRVSLRAGLATPMSIMSHGKGCDRGRTVPERRGHRDPAPGGHRDRQDRRYRRS
jgi:hypothetical protein